MAKKFLTGLNLVVLDSDPATGSEGELYFNSSASVAKIYQAGSWSVLGAGGGGGAITVSTTEPASPETGDAWYKNDTGEFYVYDGTYWVEVNGVVSLSEEQVQDYVSPLFIHNNHTNVTATYDDINNEILLNTSASITNIDSIVYPDYIVFDTTPETSSASVGTLAWDTGESNLSLQLTANSNIGIGQELIVLCNNGEATTLNKGEVVRLAGASGQRPKVMRAYNLNDDGSALTIGIVNENISAGAEGFVVTQGIVRNINTNGFDEGDTLYLSSSAGVLTNIKPQAPEHLIVVGVVAKKNAVSGRIYVKPINGFELNELHDVSISASIQNGESLVWNSASGLWMNQLVSGGGATTTVSETAPESAELGDTWYKQSDGSFFIYDGTYWVEVNGIIDGLTEDQVQDYASTLFTHNNHSNITATYDDTNGEIILTSSATQDLTPYLTQSSASTTYLTQASASTNYLTQASASTNYLTQTSASTNYLTQTSASTNYLTQTSASTNYLTQAAGSATYLTISNPVITGVTSINAIEESITLAATSAGGTIVYDVLSNNAITYYTSNASANWTLNVRGNSGTTLNSMLSTGQSLTIAFAVTNGSTAYYQTALQVDGSSVTPKWQGGSAPTSGNINSIDIYSITVIKTGDAAFTVWESQTKFA